MVIIRVIFKFRVVFIFLLSLTLNVYSFCWLILRESDKEWLLTSLLFSIPFLRSVVYQQSSKESATLQPFFTLQLDIQSDKIRTVQDALESLVARESVQGYTTKTKQEVCSHLTRNLCGGPLDA